MSDETHKRIHQKLCQDLHLRQSAAYTDLQACNEATSTNVTETRDKHLSWGYEVCIPDLPGQRYQSQQHSISLPHHAVQAPLAACKAAWMQQQAEAFCLQSQSAESLSAELQTLLSDRTLTAELQGLP